MSNLYLKAPAIKVRKGDSREKRGKSRWGFLARLPVPAAFVSSVEGAALEEGRNLCFHEMQQD